MVKKVTFNCDFGGQKAPIDFYIGDSAEKSHPIQFQSRWLADKGGTIPEKIKNSLAELKNISTQNRVNFEEVCEYAILATKEAQEINHQRLVEDKKSTIVRQYLSKNNDSQQQE